MTDMKRVTISFSDEADTCINSAREKFFPNKSKAEIVRQLVIEGFKVLERRDKRK